MLTGPRAARTLMRWVLEVRCMRVSKRVLVIVSQAAPSAEHRRALLLLSRCHKSLEQAAVVSCCWLPSQGELL